MDIERLSKMQIVMLTLLVSFVTSIATGIVTVSLMDQAPPSVEQTVNRVIERTVQTVVPSSASQTGSVAVSQEKTVVVNDSDRVAKAVQAVSPSIVRVFTSDAQAPTFIGLGVVVDKSGTIAVDVGSMGQNPDAMITAADGTKVRAFVRSRDAASGVAFLVVATSSTDTATPTWAPVTFSGEHAVLGQTVVAISGNTVTRVSNGIVAAILPATKDTPELIDTNVPDNVITAGSPLIDTNGDLVGFSTATSRASSGSAFIPAGALIRSATTN